MKIISTTRLSVANASLDKADTLIASALSILDTKTSEDVAAFNDVINPLSATVRELQKELRMYRLLTQTKLFTSLKDEEEAVRRLVSTPATLAEASKMFSVNYFSDIEDIHFIRVLCTALLDRFAQDNTDIKCPLIWRTLQDTPNLLIAE